MHPQLRLLTLLWLLAGLSCQNKPNQATAATSVADTAQLLAKRTTNETTRSASDRLMRALYFENDGDLNPFYQKTDRAQIDRFFDKPLADHLWTRATKTTKRPVINGLFNAPDAAVKKRWVLPATVVGPKAVVWVTFMEAGKPVEIRIDLREASQGRWRITEMTYPDGSRLTQLVK